MTDGDLLFEWANDPLTREMARTQDRIEPAGHVTWLASRLGSPDCRIWIALIDDTPVGQVRLDRDGEAAEIDFSVAPEKRGQGYGGAILASLHRRHAPGVDRVYGEVKDKNRPSANAFRRAGFVEDISSTSGYRRFVKDLIDG